MDESKEYELLTRELAEALARYFGVLTDKCVHDERMRGRATPNQIDVLWEGRLDGQRHRIVFECKHHKRPITQGLLHAFRSVLDDISDDVPTTGVFVSTNGYQSGAKSVASTYGIVVLELRPPQDRDLEGRLTQINLSFTLRCEVVREVQVVVEELEQVSGSLPVDPSLTWIDRPDGSSSTLRAVLTAGENSPLGIPPTPPHRVVRRFEPGTILRTEDGQRVAIRAIIGVVGDSDSTSTATIGPGADGIAHILRDALTGATVWFEKDGKITVLDAETD